MAEDNAVDKVNRMNLLFDFYGNLLTEKQRTFLICYVHDDFSLGEIAAEFAISRQAVYEHIKRAGLVLEEYEGKLQLLVKHEQRLELIHELEQRVASEIFSQNQLEMGHLLQKLLAID